LLSAVVIFLLSIIVCAGTAVAFATVTQVRAAALLPFMTSPAPPPHQP
jgi:hypothetical protein